MPSSCEPRARVVLRPGPINFIDLHPRVATELPHGVNASFDWIFQWRESLRGGVYSVPGFLLIPSGKSNGPSSGTVRVRRCGGRRIVTCGFKLITEFFYAGRFVKESQSGRNLDYWALWTGYKF